MITCPECDRLAEIFVSAGQSVTLHPCGHDVDLDQFREPIQLPLPLGV